MNSTFKKSDLKTGMRIKNRMVEWSIVLLGTKNGDIHSGEKTWGPLSYYDESLRRTSMNTLYDIIEVRQPQTNKDYLRGYSDAEGDLVWKESPQTITMNIGDIELPYVSDISEVDTVELAKVVSIKMIDALKAQFGE